MCSADENSLKQKGITDKQISLQKKHLQNGFPPTSLLRAATPNDGIVQLSETQENQLLKEFTASSATLDLLKFVPASGAATRMFKALYEDLPENADARRDVIDNLPRFAFYEQLVQEAQKIGVNKDSLNSISAQQIFDLMLSEQGLNFGNKPKGLIPFHRYPDGPRTAFEEHLYEGASHGLGRKKRVRIHFTVQSEWENEIRELLEKRMVQISGFDVDQFEIDFSFQSSSTDTVALDANGELLRDAAGQLVFRPGGHGALIHNLNALKADLIFIKNIDNVVSDQHKYTGLLHKKVMGGLALRLQHQIYRFCKAIKTRRAPLSLRNEMRGFLQEWFNIQTPEHLLIRDRKSEFLEWAYGHFDRPLRICGMVPNEGEPGGGPFWVKSADGVERLQIVEKAQIDTSNPDQAQILSQSTHFNPVDLVCGTRNYKGEQYDLLKFVDAQAGFVSEKSFAGQKIKALEHPGLWNGAMAHWNTIFLEVPASTFSPVKTVNDLLRPLHYQSGKRDQ